MSLKDWFYSVSCSNVNNVFCRTGHISKCCVKEAENSFFRQFSDSGCWGSVTRGEESEKVPPVLSLLDSSSSPTETYLLNYSPGPGLVPNSRYVCGKFGGQAHILVPPKWLRFMRRWRVGEYSQGGRGKWQSHINKCFSPFCNSLRQSACHNEIYDWAVAAWNRKRNQQFNLCHANNMSQHCACAQEVWATPLVS